MSNITFTETAFSQYLYWQTQDKRTLKKINRLLQSIDRDGPLNGIGKPEILKEALINSARPS
ncbi:type II toxin-antitoxin system YoeB family toxin [uncultured Selenomonas sp.]|uniref:type II toxin-antitoxin system YoeB family toxin n=1 Tax=uncultured Selenomonas sp. TaxID=159275 RepID=UPI0028EC6354|nr:type II toxin-antitoxin system YoeB family toxin [uncultured Selenomonas sp.]